MPLAQRWNARCVYPHRTENLELVKPTTNMGYKMSDNLKRNFRSVTALGLFLLALGFCAQPAQAQLLPGDIFLPGRVLAPLPPPPLTAGDFLCEYGAYYDTVWNGLTGVLVLSPPYWPDYLPKGAFIWNGTSYQLRYQILADPQDWIDGEQGPGFKGTNSYRKHRIVFWVDFNNTPANPADDRRFDGYMMTNGRPAIAGVVYFSNVPYGFFAHNKQCVVG